MATAAPTTKVVTGKVRLSYCHLFEPSKSPSAPESAPAKYSTTILVPKSDTATVNKIKAAQMVALENGKASKFGGKIPAGWKSTFRDADDPAEADILEKNPEYAGHYFMTVSNTRKPGVVDQNLQPILDPMEVYSGCYARVSINAYPYSAQGNKGVSFGLNNVQKMGDGESFTGATRAEDDFEALSAEEAEEVLI